MSTSEHDGEVFTHEYYLCGRMPVVVYIDQNGGWRGAKAPDSKTGQLEFSNRHMSHIQFSDNSEIEKITEEEFNRRCSEILGKADKEAGLNP